MSSFSGVVRPAALSPDKRIVVFSPSAQRSLAFPSRVHRGAHALHTLLGRPVEIHPQNLLEHGWMAGTAAEASSSLNEIVGDSSVGMIISLIGGHNSNRLLDDIDWEALLRCRPVICGYSDATALLVACDSALSLATIHGPAVLAEFGEAPAPQAFTLESLKRLLFETGPYEIKWPLQRAKERQDWSSDGTSRRQLEASLGPHVLRGGTAEGRLLGGNLRTLASLAGTKWAPRFAGRLAFWEATGEDAQLPRVHQDLVQLRDACALGDASGMIVGRLTDTAPHTGLELADVISSVLAPTYPVIIDADLGHTDPMVSLPVGLLGRLVAKPGRPMLRILERLTSP